MKNRGCSIFCIFLFVTSLYAQESSAAVSQILVPKEVYIGDSAEIHYQFHSAVHFPLDLRNAVNLDFSQSSLASMDEDCSVRKVTLSGTENQYTLTITIIPWRAGSIQFPSFDLMTLIDKKKSGFHIELKPFSISSIVDKTESKTLRPPYPPILIPGTTYAVYAAAVLLLVCVGFFIRFLLNIQSVIALYHEIKCRMRYRRNARIALHKLHVLRKEEINLDDTSFCACLQSIVRTYLESRFGYPFTTVTSDCFERTFEIITGGTLSPTQCSYIEELGNLLRRTDYIRYAHKSLDAGIPAAGEQTGSLTGKERDALLTTVYGTLRFFENRKRAAEQVEETGNV